MGVACTFRGCALGTLVIFLFEVGFFVVVLIYYLRLMTLMGTGLYLELGVALWL